MTAAPSGGGTQFNQRLATLHTRGAAVHALVVNGNGMPEVVENATV